MPCECDCHPFSCPCLNESSRKKDLILEQQKIYRASKVTARATVLREHLVLAHTKDDEAISQPLLLLPVQETHSNFQICASLQVTVVPKPPSTLPSSSIPSTSPSSSCHNLPEYCASPTPTCTSQGAAMSEQNRSTSLSHSNIELHNLSQKIIPLIEAESFNQLSDSIDGLGLSKDSGLLGDHSIARDIIEADHRMALDLAETEKVKYCCCYILWWRD